MKLFLTILLMSALSMPHAVAAKLELPLPRYVSVKSSEANIRKGPGLNYKIKWVIVRKGLPVEIIAEFEQWRKIRDIDGDEGWIHRAMINGKRTVTVLDYTHTMYKEANPDSYPVALVEAGVNAELLECDMQWCRVESEGQRGWVERDGLWGIYPDENIN